MTRSFLLLFIAAAIAGCQSTGAGSGLTGEPSLKSDSTQVRFGKKDPAKWITFSESPNLGIATCRVAVCGQTIAIVYSVNAVQAQQEQEALVARVREEMAKTNKVSIRGEPNRRTIKGYPAAGVSFGNDVSTSAPKGEILIIGAGTAEIVIRVVAQDAAVAKSAQEEFLSGIVIEPGR